MSDKNISRRDFLKRTGIAVALSACFGWLGSFFYNRNIIPKTDAVKKVKNFRIAGTEGRITTVYSKDAIAGVNTALESLGGLSTFVNKGDKVLLKPNCAFDRPAHLGATTSPEVIGEVTRLCVELGAEVRVTDNPINNPAGCFAKSGIGEAVIKNGGFVWLPSQELFKTTAIGSYIVKEWTALYEPLAWADKIIGIPTLKSHNLCLASLCMKNWYGLIGGGRNQFHQEIHKVIADLGQFITPTLVILDGTRILLTNGPTGGSPSDVMPGNVIIAGTDQVAIDARALSFLNLTVSDVEYIKLAEEKGVGISDFNKLSWNKTITV